MWLWGLSIKSLLSFTGSKNFKSHLIYILLNFTYFICLGKNPRLSKNRIYFQDLDITLKLFHYPNAYPTCSKNLIVTQMMYVPIFEEPSVPLNRDFWYEVMILRSLHHIPLFCYCCNWLSLGSAIYMLMCRFIAVIFRLIHRRTVVK